jgi:hypothetical protein
MLAMALIAIELYILGLTTSRKRMAHWRWRIAWWRWFMLDGPVLGDPIYGKGELRRRTLEMVMKKWEEREPKREDFE